MAINATPTGGGNQGGGGNNLFLDVALPGNETVSSTESKIVIPGAEKNDTVETILATNDILGNIYKTLKNQQEEQIKSNKVQQKLLDHMGVDPAMEEDQAEKKSETGKKRSKVQNYFLKKMVAMDFFGSALKGLSKIASGAGGFLMGLFKALAIFSLLGPEFLNSLITWVVDFGVMLITLFARALPGLISAIMKAIPIISEALVKAIPLIINAVAGAFTTIMGKLPADSPLRKILEFVQYLLTGPVKTGLIFIADNLGLFLGLLVGGVILVKAIAVGMMIFNAAMAIAASPVLLVAAAILLIIGVFYVMWTWGDKLVDMFMNASGWMKALVVVLALMLSPLTVMILSFYSLSKIIKWIAGGGIGELGKSIDKWNNEMYDKAKATLGNIQTAMIDGIGFAADAVSTWWLGTAVPFVKKVGKGFIKMFIVDPIMFYARILKGAFDFLGNIGSTLLKFFGVDDLGKMIKDGLSKALDSLFGEGTGTKVFAFLDQAKKAVSNFFSEMLEYILALKDKISSAKGLVTATETLRVARFAQNVGLNETEANTVREKVDIGKTREQIMAAKIAAGSDSHLKAFYDEVIAAMDASGKATIDNGEVMENIYKRMGERRDQIQIEVNRGHP